MAQSPGQRKASRTIRQIAACGAVLAVFAVILFPVFASSKNAAKGAGCVSNLRQLGLGAIMYQTDFDDRFPPAIRWAKLTYPYVKSYDAYRCPALPSAVPDEFGHGFRRSLSGARYATIEKPADTPVLFDSDDLNWNASGGYELIPSDGRYRGLSGIAFADGHAKRMTRLDLFRRLQGKQ